jgi:hypothetical protein
VADFPHLTAEGRGAEWARLLGAAGLAADDAPQLSPAGVPLLIGNTATRDWLRSFDLIA